jgi:RNA polymerase sigma-70 factor (ECF subfamily)
MSRLDGLTYGQIAAALGISIKTVETLMGRALKHLRSVIVLVLASLAPFQIFQIFL